MALTKYPNGVSSFGLPVIGGAFTSTGKVFFVDSNTGSGSYDGRDKTQPFATVTQALAKCTDSKNDIIYVMPGHKESAVTDINKIGVTVIGLGRGFLRPRFNIPATSDQLTISSCDVTVENIVVETTVCATEICIEVTKPDCTLLNCEVQMGETSETPVIGISISSDADRCVIDGFKFLTPATSYTSAALGNTAIYMAGGKEHVIQNCWLVVGCGSTDGIISSDSSSGDTNHKNMLIRNNLMIALSTSGIHCRAIIGSTGDEWTGIMADNYMAGLATADSSTPGFWFGGGGGKTLLDMGLFQNFVADSAVSSRGLLFGTQSATA